MNKAIELNISTGDFLDFFKQTRNSSHEDLISTLVLTLAKLKTEGFDTEEVMDKSEDNAERLMSFVRGNFAEDLRNMNDDGVFDTEEAQELYEEIMDSSDEVLIGFVLESLFDIKGDGKNENN